MCVYVQCGDRSFEVAMADDGFCAGRAGPIDVVMLEGWMLGFEALPAAKESDLEDIHPGLKVQRSSNAPKQLCIHFQAPVLPCCSRRSILF